MSCSCQTMLLALKAIRGQVGVQTHGPPLAPRWDPLCQMSRSFLWGAAYGAVVRISSRVPRLAHEGLSVSLLSGKSRGGELGLKETYEYGGCHTSIPAALASDLCVLSVPRSGGSLPAPLSHRSTFCPLLGSLCPRAQLQGWEVGG